MFRQFFCLIYCGVLSITAISSSELSPIQSATAAQLIQEIFEAILSEVPSNHFFSVGNMRKLLEKYSSEELKLVYLDFCQLKEKTFREAEKTRDYLVTAGGPAAGKSTILEGLIEGGSCPDLSFTYPKRAYIDPDRSCLLHMEHTYRADLASGDRTPQTAYEHWREASNFLSNVYLAIALKEGYAIAHGSTMASPFAKNALNAIKNIYGYQTTLVHVTCDEAVRLESEQRRRDGGVVQCTDLDLREKQALFLTLLSDYVLSADKVIFAYRKSFTEVVFAAKAENGQVEVYDQEALQSIGNLHSKERWEQHFPSAGGSN